MIVQRPEGSSGATRSAGGHAPHPSSAAVHDAGASPWLTRRRIRRDAHLRLFCFPYAGGSAVVYRAWEGRLPPRVELHPVHLPGRGRRLNEPPYRDAQTCARAAAAGLLPYLDGPFALFGHSMGAVIAFELARLLQREYALIPVKLIVSAREGPRVPRREPPMYHLPDTEFLDRLRELDGTPKELLENPEAMALVLPTLRADFELAQSYTWREAPPVRCPIRAFAGREDRTTTIEGVAEWAAHTRGGFAVHEVAGDHFSMLHADALVDHLADECRALTSRLA